VNDTGAEMHGADDASGVSGFDNGNSNWNFPVLFRVLLQRFVTPGVTLIV
jgi:hypothetical protein